MATEKYKVWGQGFGLMTKFAALAVHTCDSQLSLLSPTFYQCRPWGAAGDCSSSWVPDTHMGYLDWGPGSGLGWAGVGIWGLNCCMGNISIYGGLTGCLKFSTEGNIALWRGRHGLCICTVYKNKCHFYWWGKYFQFVPLRVWHIGIPSGSSFVISFGGLLQYDSV